MKKQVFYVFLNCFELFVDLGGFGGDLGVLSGPPHHHPTPSPASMSKFPSGGEQVWKQMFCLCFSVIVMKIEKVVLK